MHAWGVLFFKFRVSLTTLRVELNFRQYCNRISTSDLYPPTTMWTTFWCLGIRLFQSEIGFKCIAIQIIEKISFDFKAHSLFTVHVSYTTYFGLHKEPKLDRYYGWKWKKHTVLILQFFILTFIRHSHVMSCNVMSTGAQQDFCNFRYFFTMLLEWAYSHYNP